jgi:hypothetical protein
MNKRLGLLTRRRREIQGVNVKYLAQTDSAAIALRSAAPAQVVRPNRLAYKLAFTQAQQQEEQAVELGDKPLNLRKPPAGMKGGGPHRRVT